MHGHMNVKFVLLFLLNLTRISKVLIFFSKEIIIRAAKVRSKFAFREKKGHWSRGISFIFCFEILY
jgi:hypothetical protein